MVNDDMRPWSYVWSTLPYQTVKQVEQKYDKIELTEHIVRQILHCPKGYMVVCDAMTYSPFIITDKNILDCDGDTVDYIDFIYDIDGRDYEIKKEPEVVEMTMEEVCKALGKTVKIVKGDNE